MSHYSKETTYQPTRRTHIKWQISTNTQVSTEAFCKVLDTECLGCHLHVNHAHPHQTYAHRCPQRPLRHGSCSTGLKQNPCFFPTFHNKVMKNCDHMQNNRATQMKTWLLSPTAHMIFINRMQEKNSRCKEDHIRCGVTLSHLKVLLPMRIYVMIKTYVCLEPENNCK